MWRKLWNLIKKIWSSPMGHSINDIPARFRSPHKKAEFIQWLSELPVMEPVKRMLIQTWTRSTGRPFISSDFARAGLPKPRK